MIFLIAGVLVELSNKKIDRVFDYEVPEELQESMKLGIRVEVPFGNRILEGFVLELKETTTLSQLKKIIRIVDEDIVLNEELLALGKVLQKW